jgi:hypothetical protein
MNHCAGLGFRSSGSALFCEVQRMIFLVCGSRIESRSGWVWWELDGLVKELGAPQLVVTGCAAGVDLLAGDWAITRGIVHARFRAPWDVLRRQAGPVRNHVMATLLKPPILAIVFPGGRGTDNMARTAEKAGIKLRIVDPERSEIL